MTERFTEEQVREALQHCADEPVHIPGIVQPFGWLLAYSVDTQEVHYASDNSAAALKVPIEEVLGTRVGDLLGREIWHGLQNLIATRNADARRQVVGTWRAGEDDPSFIVGAWQSGDYVVVEFEEHSGEPLLSLQEMQMQSSLTNQLQNAQDQNSMFALTTKLLRHLTGFDRVMIYRFDQDWNGEVIAESHSGAVEPFLGLNFPSFDIPSQARAIMARLPLRLISDIDQNTVPLSALRTDLPPLDISLAETRGTSPVHIEYLRNMGSAATMTLSVVVDGMLWGIISFHHTTPRLVSPQIRMILRSYLEIFCLKLNLFVERRLQTLSDTVDSIQAEFQELVRSDPDLGDLLERLGSRLENIFQSCGLYIQSEKGEYVSGDVPSKKLIDEIVRALPEDKSSPFFTDNIRRDLRINDTELDPFAGLGAVFHLNDWMLLIFRKETAQSVAWAGDPEKTIEFAEGSARLSPRGSFSTFLAEAKGRSLPWTGEDQVLAKKLWMPLSTTLSSEEKKRYMKDLHRQQELMIDELNHRVRNILALVQSVSTEAKRSQSSLESYSKAIEARVRALAAAHSIGSGSSAKQVDIGEIVFQEAKPYQSEADRRVHVSGVKMAITSELAPIFALTVHELMTNAAKYGALSNAVGKVQIEMKAVSDGLELLWAEVGGPSVQTPNRTGFGATLIKRAVPYELGGASSLIFASTGVQARIRLPASILSSPASDDASDIRTPDFQENDANDPSIPAKLTSGVAIVVEDNFVIAEGVAHQLKGLGFERTETFSTQEAALDFVERETPSFALLDVNLGHGKTSFHIAELLLDRNVPIVFLTGYGDLPSQAPRLNKQIVLTKPVDNLELAHAIARTSGE